MLLISKDLKCFCMDYMKSGDQEKKSKHIKPVIKLLHQLIVVSCKEQPEVMYYMAIASTCASLSSGHRYLPCASVMKSY